METKLQTVKNFAESLIDSEYLPKSDASQLPLIFNVVFAIFGAIAVLYVVWSGIALILSQGNPEKVAQARRAIIYAVVGLVVISLSWTIVAFIYSRVNTI